MGLSALMDRSQIRVRVLARPAAALVGGVAVLALVVPGLLEGSDPPPLPPDVGLAAGEPRGGPEPAPGASAPAADERPATRKRRPAGGHTPAQPGKPDRAREPTLGDRAKGGPPDASKPKPKPPVPPPPDVLDRGPPPAPVPAPAPATAPPPPVPADPAPATSREATEFGFER